MCRPSFKCRCISRHRSEVAIMQPVQDLLLLTQARVPLTIFPVLSSSMAKSGFGSILIALTVVCFFPAAPDEQHVTMLNVASLGSGSNINSLVLAALVKLLP